MSSVPAVLAVGTFGGSLRDVPAADLGATVIAEALKRGNVKGEWLDEVMFGNVLSAAQGQNVARQCMVKAGVPLKVPAYTVSMVCGSGLKSVIEGARQCGDADLVMCGGTESMSGRSLCHPHQPLGRPDGPHPDHRHHDQGRPVGRLQQLSHGYHR